MRLPSIVSLLAIVCLTYIGAVTAEEKRELTDDSVVRGQALVMQNCSGCHAVGITGESPNPKAPPFRQLSERFPIDALEETFIGTIDTGHPGMPVFEASQQQIDDILDYIASVME
jgi:mono/diheme cytochrome c family protein